MLLDAPVPELDLELVPMPRAEARVFLRLGDDQLRRAASSDAPGAWPSRPVASPQPGTARLDPLRRRVQRLWFKAAGQHGSAPTATGSPFVRGLPSEPLRHRGHGPRAPCPANGPLDPASFRAPRSCSVQAREVVEDAYPGDVIGLNNPRHVFAWRPLSMWVRRWSTKASLASALKIFSWLRTPTLGFKAFRKGVNERREEGAVQVLYRHDLSKAGTPILRQSPLQLEVVHIPAAERIRVETPARTAGLSPARWVTGWLEAPIELSSSVQPAKTVRECLGPAVLLFKTAGTSTSST